MTEKKYCSNEKIEIIDSDILNKNEELIVEFKKISEQLEVTYGWHYFLDFMWTVQELGDVKGKIILDAGASTGLLQWWLAKEGARVISVDIEDRSQISNNFGAWCTIRGLRKQDFNQSISLKQILPSRNIKKWKNYPKKFFNFFKKIENTARRTTGEVFLYNQNLNYMPDILDNSIDLVVSISALEHNSLDGLKLCVRELNRVLKKKGKMVITVNATKEQDWFHQPSQGWCFTEQTLRSLFSLDKSCPSNFYDYDVLFAKLERCKKLQDLLPDMYKKSGESGLPWGIWKPMYQPVGIII